MKRAKDVKLNYRPMDETGGCVCCAKAVSLAPNCEKAIITKCGDVRVGQYMVCDEYEHISGQAGIEVDAELKGKPYVSYEEYSDRMDAKIAEIAKRPLVADEAEGRKAPEAAV